MAVTHADTNGQSERGAAARGEPVPGGGVASRIAHALEPPAGPWPLIRSETGPSGFGAVIPIALSAGTVMGIFLMTVIVLGYVAIWAIWHFLFRGQGGDDARGRARHEHPDDTSGAPE